MCGIAGIIGFHAEDHARESVVQRMIDEIAYRGPDDSGVYANGRIALGHRRLSIIDTTSGGHQPMLAEDGQFALVFNGEIYNFRELRTTYLKEVPLRSQSDTEVLLQLLMLKGKAALPLLKGMFALAFWDNKRQQLLLARGPFGKKPLYYAQVGDEFVFASEAKAIIAHPGFVSALDEVATAKYLLHEYVPAPATGFVGMQEVPMGYVMTVSAGGQTLLPWWEPSFLPKYQQTETDVLRRFDELLGQATARRLVADVPVGVFLSGGLDSTTIAWYMRQQQSDLHSFSISFTDPSFDERSYAQTAARALGATHHVCVFDTHAFRRSVDELTHLVDIPFADASLLPTYVLSQQAAQHVKVVLDGDGSDELLGGYGTFAAAMMANRLMFVPVGVWSAIQQVADWLPVSHTYFSFDFKVKSFLRGMGKPLLQRNQAWLGAFLPDEAQALCTERLQQFVTSMFDDVDTVAATQQGLDWFDRVSDATMRQYLHNEILVKLDRATMYASIEARTPFLDVDLVEFLMHVPTRWRHNKLLLKRLMRGRIPDEIIDRPKKGFGIPIGRWFQSDLFDWVGEVLSPTKLEADGLFHYSYVQRLLDEHRRKVADHRKKIWTLVAFQLWYDRWIIGRSVAQAGISKHIQDR